jgi:hypothetical protein
MFIRQYVPKKISSKLDRLSHKYEKPNTNTCSEMLLIRITLKLNSIALSWRFGFTSSNFWLYGVANTVKSVSIFLRTRNRPSNYLAASWFHVTELSFKAVLNTAGLENVKNHFFLSDSEIKIDSPRMPSAASIYHIRTILYHADYI